jgi:hypothetical protein
LVCVWPNLTRVFFHFFLFPILWYKEFWWFF